MEEKYQILEELIVKKQYAHIRLWLNIDPKMQEYWNTHWKDKISKEDVYEISYHEILDIMVKYEDYEEEDNDNLTIFDFLAEEHVKQAEFELFMIPIDEIICFQCLEVIFDKYQYIPEAKYCIIHFSPDKLRHYIKYGLDPTQLYNIYNIWHFTVFDQIVEILREFDKTDRWLLEIMFPILYGEYEHVKRLQLAFKLGYNPFVNFNLFESKRSKYRTQSQALMIEIVNQRNNMDAIFNIWDTFEERQLIRYIMIYQAVIPGINLLPIELMRVIFGYMRYICIIA